jgi:hypothetical protein
MPVTAARILINLAVGFDAAYKGTVDLERVQRQLAQGRQRRIPGAEIVHTDSGTQRPQPHQQR